MYRTTRLFAFLISFVLLLPSCTKNTSSSGEDEANNAPQAFADMGENNGGKRSAHKINPQFYSLNADKYMLNLATKGEKPQMVSCKGQVLRLSLNGKETPSLSMVKVSEKPAVFMGLNGPYFHRFSLEKLDMAIETNKQGGWTLTDKAGDFELDASAYDCEDIYMTGDDGNLYVVNPPKPITVTVDGFSLNFLREGKSDGVDVPHEEGVILAPCDELLSEPRSFVYQGGGLGTVILVDNIIDPDLVDQAKGAGASDAFQAEGANAFLSAVKKLDEQYQGSKCPSIEDKSWSDEPVIGVQFGFQESTMTIYCDTWLVIEDGSEKRCINIVTCGAKLEVDGDMLNVYSGCPDDPSQDCPY